MKCPGSWIPVRYPPIKTKTGRLLPGDICAAFHPNVAARMGPTRIALLIQDLAKPRTPPPDEIAPPMGPAHDGTGITP